LRKKKESRYAAAKSTEKEKKKAAFSVRVNALYMSVVLAAAGSR
jgi:hypothetical protein